MAKLHFGAPSERDPDIVMPDRANPPIENDKVISERRIINDPTAKSLVNKSNSITTSKVFHFSFFLLRLLETALFVPQTGGVVQWVVGSDNGLLHMPCIVYAETRAAKCQMFVKILTVRIEFHENHTILYPACIVPIRLVFTDSPTQAQNALEDAYEELGVKFGENSKWGPQFDCKFCYDSFHACHNLNAVALAHCDRRSAQQDFAFLLNLTRKRFHSHSAHGLNYDEKKLEIFKMSANVEILRKAISGDKSAFARSGHRVVALRKEILEAGEMSQWYVISPFFCDDDVDSISTGIGTSERHCCNGSFRGIDN